jgi:hypothetical protein
MDSVIKTASTSTAKSDTGPTPKKVVPPFERASDFNAVAINADKATNENRIPEVTPAKMSKTQKPTNDGYSPNTNESSSRKKNVHSPEAEETSDHTEGGYSPIPEDEIFDDEIESEQAETINKTTNNEDDEITVTTASTVHKPYMTWLEFNDYGLDKTPKLVCHFWIEHPRVIMNYMKHWVFTNKYVEIPYFWNPIDFICKPTMPPKTNEKNTKYVKLNMFNVIEQCQEALKHQKYTGENAKEKKEIEKLIRYTPTIADAKKHLETAEFQVRKAANQLPLIKRKITTLHGDNNKEKLKKAKMMLNVKEKQVLDLQRARDVAKKEEEYAIETVESMIIMFKREAETETLTKRPTDDEEEWNQMCKEFDMEEEITTNRKEINSSKEQYPRQVTCSGHGTINNTNSQISGVTTQSQDTSTTNSKPVVLIEDIPFSECNALFSKYDNMKQKSVNITTTNKATDAAVMINPDTTSMLNHDTKEIVKITSNDLQRSECRRWNSATTLEIFSSKDTFCKCIRNRPPLKTIDSLKDKPEVVLLSKKMDLTIRKFQKETQHIINTYMAMEVDQHEKERFTSLEKSLKKIIRSHSTKIVKEEEERRKTYHTLQRIENPVFNVSMDEVCGFTYLFLLLGPASTTLTAWSELPSPEKMMNALTKTLAVPTRIPMSELEVRKESMKTIKLGSMMFAAPSEDVWILATRAAKDMHELVAEFALGSKTKFYNKIIDAKGNKAVRDLQYTKETIDTTAKVTKMLKNAKSVEQKIGLNVIKKFLTGNTYAILNKRDSSIKSTSPVFRNNKKNDHTTPDTTTTATTQINNNINKSSEDTTAQTDETTAKRMRDRRKEEQQRTNIIQQEQWHNNNNHNQGRGGRGGRTWGGRDNGNWGRRGGGRGRPFVRPPIINTYRRRTGTKEQTDHDQTKSNKKQKY